MADQERLKLIRRAHEAVVLATGQETENGNPVVASKYYVLAMELVISAVQDMKHESSETEEYILFQCRQKLEDYYARAKLLLSVAEEDGLDIDLEDCMPFQTVTRPPQPALPQTQQRSMPYPGPPLQQAQYHNGYDPHYAAIVQDIQPLGMMMTSPGMAGGQPPVLGVPMQHQPQPLGYPPAGPYPPQQHTMIPPPAVPLAFQSTPTPPAATTAAPQVGGPVGEPARGPSAAAASSPSNEGQISTLPPSQTPPTEFVKDSSQPTALENVKAFHADPAVAPAPDIVDAPLVEEGQEPASFKSEEYIPVECFLGASPATGGEVLANAPSGGVTTKESTEPKLDSNTRRMFGDDDELRPGNPDFEELFKKFSAMPDLPPTSQ